MPSVPHSQQPTQTVAQQKRAADNTADDLEETPCLEPPHAAPKEAPVRSVLTVLPPLLRRCIRGAYSPAARMLPAQVLPAAGAVSSTGPPSGSRVDDLSFLVVGWVNQFNGRLHRQ